MSARPILLPPLLYEEIEDLCPACEGSSWAWWDEDLDDGEICDACDGEGIVLEVRVRRWNSKDQKTLLN